MKKIFFLLLFTGGVFLFFPSCKSLLFKLKGVKSPKLETAQSVYDYLQKHYQGTLKYLFVPRDSASFYSTFSSFPDFPGVGFVNSKGQLIIYSDTNYCSGTAQKFATGLEDPESYPTDPFFKLTTFMEMLQRAGPESTENDEPYDCILIVFWAKYLGSINKPGFDVAEGLEKNSRVRSRIYFINLDFQEQWGLKTIPKIKF
jgi:hypothetical protein